MTREPPNGVKRQLRREVRFGCPVETCGSPYLTYHHFNPPWRKEQHHDPERMIALCWTHHNIAEGGGFSVQQLRALKQRPYLATQKVQWRFDVWDRRRLVILAGGNWFFDPPFVLSVRGHVVVGLTQPPDPAEPGGLNLDARNASGEPVLSMEANAWNLDIVPDDLECSPRGNALEVSHKQSQLNLSVRFDSLEPEDLIRLFDRLAMEEQQRSDVLENAVEWPIGLCTVEGKLAWPIPVQMTGQDIIGNRQLYEMNIFSGHGIIM